VIAVTNEHEVFSWGRGDNGRLGLGTQDSHASPLPVPIPEHFQPSKVCCGVDCSVILQHYVTKFVSDLQQVGGFLRYSSFLHR
jgi:alpha-tubulin suppressor-like RCC1 family protein